MSYQAEKLSPKGIFIHGFTLVELLVVIAILAILIGMIIGGVRVAIKKAHNTKVKMDTQVVVSVMNKYLMEYNRWPSFATNAVSCTDTNWVAVMSPDPTQATTQAPDSDNLKRIPFLEAGGGTIQSNGFVDSWRNPFWFQVDVDRDGLITNPQNSSEPPIRANCIAWSDGGKSNSAVFFIKSWEEMK